MMFQTLKNRVKLTTTITTRLFSGESFRRQPFNLRHNQPLYREGVSNTVVTQPNMIPTHNLFNVLYKLGPNATGKVPDILHTMILSGKTFTKFTLIDCVKQLRKFRRYQQCLEILEWIVKSRYELSNREYALHLSIICKVKGIDEAEKYFDCIPPDAKDQCVFGALLHCYCSQLVIDKAVAVFKKVDEMGYVTNVLPFSDLMCLYVKGGQPEKVPEVVEDMKRRNIPLDGYTYSVWIQSYKLLGDIEGSERVMHEAQEQGYLKNDRRLYSNIAAVYIEFNQSEKAVPVLEKLEDFLDNSNVFDLEEYHYLVSLYAGAGKIESVTRVWDKLLAKFNGGNNTSYRTMLQALSILDDMEGILKCFKEWDSSYKRYDERVAAAVIGAYLKRDMVEEAEHLLKDATRKAERIPRTGHVKFMNYYFEKRQTDSALKHMGMAIAGKWKPVAEKLDTCFQVFKEEKDVDGAEEFLRLLKKAWPLDTRAYLWLLQTYSAANLVPPDIPQRIKEDGVVITPELKDLLERVCLNSA